MKIGNYCRLENVELSGNTVVGDLVGLTDVKAADTVFESNPLSTEIGSPIAGLGVSSEIEYCRFDRVRVGRAVSLKFVEAAATVVPAGMSIDSRELGVPSSADLGIPLFLSDEKLGVTDSSSNALDQLVLSGYCPGILHVR